MKKILLVILALLMIVSLASCSDGVSPIETSDLETSGQTSAATSDKTTSETSAQTSESTEAATTEEEQTSADTEPLAPAKTKVAIFTDPHSALIDTKVNTRRPSLSPVKIKKMMDKFVKMGVEYVICLGDFIENAYDDEENTEMLEMLMGIINTYDIEFYTLMGNHDCDAFTKEEFYEIAGLDSAPTTARVGDALFVYLDANFLDENTSYAPGNIDWTKAYIPQEQLDFYKNAWQNTDAKEVYVFLHQNLDTNIANQKYWIQNAEQVRSALAECPKLKGVYQGHYHSGITSVFDGVPYITVPAVCEGENMPYIILDV